jgi:protein O-mannosyl-transferase
VALGGFIWMAILLGPTVVAARITGVAADRYAYLPLVGFGVALVQLLQLPRSPAMQWVVRAVAGLWLVVLALISWRTVPVWRTNLALYTHAVQMTPQSSMAHYRLGYALAVDDRTPEAARQFERAIALDPANTRALNNLGVSYLRT